MSKVKVIPCSGIGKVHGFIARETVLKVVNELNPDFSETVCLAHIVTGDQDAKEKIEGFNCITIDGCPKLCAAKNTALAGGIIIEELRVVDELKNHRGAKPGTATELTEEGWTIVDDFAQKISAKIDSTAKGAQ